LLKTALLILITIFPGISFGDETKLEQKMTPPRTRVIVASPTVCPYVCDSSENRPGYIEEMFKAIGRENQIDFEFVHTEKKYAEQLFKDSQVDVVLFADELFRLDMKSNSKFKMGKVEIGKIKPALFSYQNNGIGIKNLRMSKENWPLVFGAKKVVLAPFDSFNHWISMISKQIGNNGEKFNFKKALTELQYGVKDLILHDANVFHYQLSKLPFDYGVTEVGVIESAEEESSIFALTNESMNKGDSVAAVLSRGLIHLRRKGNLQRMLNSYKIADWEKKVSLKPLLSH
jgi:hypothetical protein